MHRVTIINTGEDLIPTNIYIDDVEVGGVTGLRYFSLGVDEIPVFQFDVKGFLDVVEINRAKIEFRFVPDTVREAICVIRHALETDGDFYNAFMASIESSLEKCPDLDTGHINTGEVARKVLDRIIGEELDV